MNIFRQTGVIIVAKGCILCRIICHAALSLLLICWRKLTSTHWTHWSMQKQSMGGRFGLCQKKPKVEEMDTDPLGVQLQEQIKQNGILRADLEALESKLQIQNEMIEKQFGKDIARTAKGRFNNAGETVQPTTLSYKFKQLFDEEWREVMKSLFREDKELQGIKFLSKILEDCQSFCQEKARQQLVSFVNPYPEEITMSVEDVLMSQEEQHNLYKLRSIIGQHENTKRNVINLFSRECKTRKDYCKVIEDIQDSEEGMESIEMYINSCCGLCWQCAIIDPPVFLKFVVPGGNFDDVVDNFQEYHFKDTTDETGLCNTVMQVVWPAVVMKDEVDNIDILIENTKGYVIVYRSSSV